jgi:hypothetical protein
MTNNDIDAVVDYVRGMRQEEFIANWDRQVGCSERLGY